MLDLYKVKFYKNISKYFKIMLNYYAIELNVIENNICSLSGNVVKYRDWKTNGILSNYKLLNY